MRGGEQVLAALGALDERAQTAVHGWVLGADVLSMKQQVRGLADRGLVEIAGREDRAELSVWEGTVVLWAARLSPAGHDLLLYARTRPRPGNAVGEPDAGQRLVKLLPSQMAALRLFLGLAGRLRVPVAVGLAEQARTARSDHGARRWLLYLTPEQMQSVGAVTLLGTWVSDGVPGCDWPRRQP